MADFVAVLKKTIEGLPDNNPETRARIYDRARATIDAKLKALTPPPAAEVADRQREVLENAIAEVEAIFAPPPPPQEDVFDPLSDSVFDDVFASLNGPAPRPEPDPAAPEEAVASPDHVPAEPADPVFEPSAGPEPDFDEHPAESADAPHLAGDGPQKPAPSFQPQRRETSPRLGRWLIAALILLALGVGGYAAWHNRDDLVAMLGGTGQEEPAAEQPADLEAEPEQDIAAEPEPAEATPAPVAPAAPASAKFTQRLNEDGTESDTGPGGGATAIGEGTSVAAATQPLDEQAEAQAEPSAAPAQGQGNATALAVGQQAMFYEERTTSAAGTAERGSTVWTVVQESPGGEQPAEPAIRAEVSIPSRDLQLRLTIRRNADPSLPASHIVEMIFLTPDDFSGGGINDVLRMAMKPTEEDAGNALFGIPAKIADGFFLFALSDRAAEAEANRTMLRRQGWIDIPVVYKSGRRALVTLEKGLPGEEAFNEALDAWQAGNSG